LCDTLKDSLKWVIVTKKKKNLFMIVNKVLTHFYSCYCVDIVFLGWWLIFVRVSIAVENKKHIHQKETTKTK